MRYHLDDDGPTCRHPDGCEAYPRCSGCQNCERHCDRSPNAGCMNADGLAYCEGCDERRPLVLRTTHGSNRMVEYFCARCVLEITNDCVTAPTILTPIAEQESWPTPATLAAA